jgi:hypothetical protein
MVVRRDVLTVRQVTPSAATSATIERADIADGVKAVGAHIPPARPKLVNTCEEWSSRITRERRIDVLEIMQQRFAITIAPPFPRRSVRRRR